VEILVCARRVPDTSENEIELNSAGNDIERATDLSRRMVCEWGMSDKLGPLTYGRKEQEIFLGREISQHRDFSESIAIEIDNEVRRIVNENYDRAKNIIKTHFSALKALAEALLEKESLDAPEIEKIIQSAMANPA